MTRSSTPAFLFITTIVALGVASWLSDIPGGLFFLLAGVSGLLYSAWRLANPQWREDAFWLRHRRFREWVDGRFLPRFVDARLGVERTNRINDLIGLFFGVAAIALGVALLT
jgi:hypothetical protein